MRGSASFADASRSVSAAPTPHAAPFSQARMGHRFYEHTVPELVRQLEVNKLLLATYGLINAAESVMDTDVGWSR